MGVTSIFIAILSLLQAFSLPRWSQPFVNHALFLLGQIFRLGRFYWLVGGWCLGKGHLILCTSSAPPAKPI